MDAAPTLLEDRVSAIAGHLRKFSVEEQSVHVGRLSGFRHNREWPVSCSLLAGLSAACHLCDCTRTTTPAFASGQLLIHHSSWVGRLFCRISFTAGGFLATSQKHSLLHSAFPYHCESGFLQECHHYASGLLLLLLQWRSLSWLSLLPIYCCCYPACFCQ